MKRGMRLALLLGTFAVLAATAGCVERTMKIQTNPPGALVVVNDEEVGVSPVRLSFLWYGDYDIIVRKPGYETLKTHHLVKAPWYECPPLDIVSELMVPWMVRDEHILPTMTLEPAQQPSVKEMVERASRTRAEALESQD